MIKIKTASAQEDCMLLSTALASTRGSAAHRQHDFMDDAICVSL